MINIHKKEEQMFEQLEVIFDTVKNVEYASGEMQVSFEKRQELLSNFIDNVVSDLQQVAKEFKE